MSARNVNQPKMTYPAYVVKPSEKEPATVRAITVDKPERSVEDTNELLRKLVDMLTPGANTTMKAPESSTLDKLVHLLKEKVAERKPALPATQEPTRLVTIVYVHFV